MRRQGRAHGWAQAAMLVVAAALLSPAPALAQGNSGDGRPTGRGYQEPAYARGFSDGHRQGLDDGRHGDRYDPAGHKEYREAEQGFYRGYGSKGAYRNNYRAGFRAGYEEGYREGGRQ